MGKIVEKLRKEAQEAAQKYPDANASEDEYVLVALDDMYRELVDEQGIGLEWTATTEAIPIIEECIEKKDPTAYNQWVQKEIDAIPDGVVW